MSRASDPQRPFWADALHIAVLSGFAVAQPIYDLLGRGAEFFVAHRLGPVGILLFVAGLSLGLPAILIAVEGLVGLVSRRARRWVHLLFVFALVTAFAMQAMNSLTLPSAAILAAAAAAGLAFAVLYRWQAPLRSFVTILSPGIIAFPVMFLTLTPVAGLVRPQPQTVPSPMSQTTIRNPAPIIFILFDEFEAGGLLTEAKTIDEVRFPNLAALAQDGWWFPNATSVWTETQRAVPAILTGLRPRGHQVLPNVQSHPNNLFTWLGGSYRLNVSEPLTNLCPQSLCQVDPTVGATTNPALFLSDLGVIYLHIAMPRPMAATWLPRMDGTWRGFAAPAQGTDEGGEGRTFRERFGDVVAGDRREQFKNFIQSIRADDKRTLNFLHILLPHDPYIYLPSGSTYPGGNTEGLIERTWIADDQLAKLGYHRYLLQVGYVDRMIGELIGRLKEQGLYDEALIVLTADHGKAFIAGQPKRTLVGNVKGNAPDLLQIPMFVKMPGQREGRVSDRRVLTIDILPTIAEALGTSLPWRADGVSMVGDRFPSRDILEIAPLDENSQPVQFDARELTSYPRLGWKIENFGFGTPLAETTIKDPNSHLLGKRLEDLTIGEEVLGIEVSSNQLSLFDDVRLSTKVIPALLQGEILSAAGLKGPLPIAIALNGTIVATTRTSSWLGSPLYFATMLPETAFRDGRNLVEVFVVGEANGGVQLSRIPSLARDGYMIGQDQKKQPALVSQTRGVLLIDPDAAKTYLDFVHNYRPWYFLSGWALDAKTLDPVDRLILFIDGKQVFTTKPARERLDLISYFKRENVRMGGFGINLPKEIIRGRRSAKVQLFAVTKDGRATEVPVAEAVRAAMQGS